MDKGFNFEAWTREIIVRPSDRDKQVKVGASNMSQPCARHLAFDMLGINQEKEVHPVYGMKAVIGTAVHAYIENMNRDPDVLVEVRVTLGEIPGYGTVKSTSDQFHVPTGTVGDLKTTETKKLPDIQAAWRGVHRGYEVDNFQSYAVQSHINQMHLYGLGQENAGYDVNWLQITYVCRDGGSPENHIWGSPPLRYDRDHALKVWNRAVDLWKWLQDGNDVNTLEHTKGCFPCKLEKEEDYVG